MGIQDILNSQAMTKLVLKLGQSLPTRPGYGFARLMGTILGRRTYLTPVKAVRANQWVISNGKATAAELNRLALETYRTAAHCIFDFYHYMNNPKALTEMVEYSPEFEEIYQRSVMRKEGVILALCHLANFDLVGRAVALRGMPLFAITAPEAAGGYRISNQLRRQFNIEAYPASLEAVHMAVDRLRHGGTVVMGADRPFSDSHHRPRFFGRPAALPVAHIRLALKFNMPVYALGGCLKPDGNYRLWASEPVEMLHTGDKDQDVVVNAERVLAKIEENIRQFRTQWNMTYAVWPEVLPEVP
ncbi:lauroyl/myristoyl acyltransferase [Longilinea arvoryzae]|uniref:Lauroyl/myristoyl acyltransferase n=2 Tax=Longilinea arvoryzae TaxID=360412 RepID=A0A0K8MZ90_9CHLR|nr:lauroyl/myristoyl acyltransferase [Longilinea arvoryzae]